MAKVTPIDVPPGSLLAEFGEADAYRDCFVREVASTVSLEAFVERFYCSMAFRPERLVLGLIGRGASNADARAVARGEVEHFAAWDVIGRRRGDRKGDCPPAAPNRARGDRAPDGVRNTKTPALEAKQMDQILLRDFQGRTASWLAVAPSGNGSTRLLFGSWVGDPTHPAFKALLPFHVWYSRVLLGGVRA